MNTKVVAMIFLVSAYGAVYAEPEVFYTQNTDQQTKQQFPFIEHLPISTLPANYHSPSWSEYIAYNKKAVAISSLKIALNLYSIKIVYDLVSIWKNDIDLRVIVACYGITRIYPVYNEVSKHYTAYQTSVIQEQ